jgi:Putative Ig domain
MGTTAFDPESFTNGMRDSRWEVPQNHPSGPADVAQTVVDLLQNKSMSDTFGVHGEWEVRTALVVNRQAWRYHSSVFFHGKERKKGFPPIHVDRTRQIRKMGTVTQDMLLAFAREAVEVHAARCEGIKEYLTLAPLFSQPTPRHDGAKKVVLVLLGVAVLLTAYWRWHDFKGIGSTSPDPQPPLQSMQWQPLQVSHQYAAGEPFEFSLPRLERTPVGTPVEVALEASGDEPGWLQLDRERLQIRGTAPLTAANQTYRLSVRARAAQGTDSRLVVLLTITGEPPLSPPVRQLPGHWTW